MKKLFLITIILLLQSFPSFGDINNKGFVCECIENCQNMKNHFEEDRLYLFKDHFLYRYQIERQNDEYKIVQSKPLSFSLDHSIIYLDSHRLNRKSLILSFGPTLYFDENNYKEGYVKYKCELLTEEKFKLKIYNIKDEFQKKYYLKQNDNKI